MKASAVKARQVSESRPNPVDAREAAKLWPGLKRLFRLTWMAKQYFLVAIAGGICYALLQILTSSLIGEATEKAIVPSFAQGKVVVGATWTLAAALVGVAVLRAATIVGRRAFTSFGMYELHWQFRTKLLRVFSQTPLQWHRNRSTGTLLSAVYADTEAAVQAIISWAYALSTGVMVIYVTVMVALIDWVMLSVLVLVFGLLIGLNLVFQTMITPVVIRMQELRAEVSDIAHESFDGGNVVKALGREDDEDERFGTASEELRDVGIKFGYLRGWFDPLIDALPNIGIILFALLGAWRMSEGHLTTGELVQVSYLFTLMAVPIRSFGWVLGNLSRTVVGTDRVEAIVNTETDQHRGTDEVEKIAAPARLVFENVSLEYDDEAGRASSSDPALHDVSFAADPEEGSRVLAVVGSTGSGKSTLTLLASRLLDPTKGRILLDGHDMQALSTESLHSSVALALQQAFIFDESVRENIALGGTFTDEQIWRALEIAQAREFVEGLGEGLETVLGERGGSLSGGQRQRLALARALVREPRLLILDDATSACDPAIEAAILHGIRTHMTSSTLLVVAYRKSTISIADRVVFMSGGTVKGIGTHEELSASDPEYSSLVNAYDEAAIAHNLLETDNGPRRGGGHYNMGTKTDADREARLANEKRATTGTIPAVDPYQLGESTGLETGQIPALSEDDLREDDGGGAT